MIEVVESELCSYVQTPSGEAPSIDERDEACRLGFEMRKRAQGLCPRVGVCAVGVEYTSHQAVEGQAFGLDEYKLACDPKCPLDLDVTTQVV